MNKLSIKINSNLLKKFNSNLSKKSNTNLFKKSNTNLSKKSNTNLLKNNLVKEEIKIYYPETLLDSIKNNQDITNYSSIYSKSPNVFIKNKKNKIYLITMTDPDAPYGINTNKDNHIYTHWVYIKDMRNITNINKKNNILISYMKPSPPYGIHRYQFNLYDLTNVEKKILDRLKQENVNRNTYYKDYIKNLEKYKLNTIFQYRVNSKK